MPEAETAECRHFRVTGRVQGVFFRASTRRRAAQLGLTGWARNEPDGSVDVLVCGSAARLDEIEQWLWQGPEMAIVDQVKPMPVDCDAPADFT